MNCYDLFRDAESLGWKKTDDYQVCKQINKTTFALIEANPLTNSDDFVVSKPMLIYLEVFFSETNPSGYSNEMESIIFSFYESFEVFEEAYEGDVGFRNQLLAEMIYESTSELNPDYGKVDETTAFDYLCAEMQRVNEWIKKGGIQ